MDLNEYKRRRSARRQRARTPKKDVGQPTTEQGKVLMLGYESWQKGHETFLRARELSLLTKQAAVVDYSKETIMLLAELVVRLCGQSWEELKQGVIIDRPTADKLAADLQRETAEE